MKASRGDPLRLVDDFDSHRTAGSDFNLVGLAFFSQDVSRLAMAGANAKLLLSVSVIAYSPKIRPDLLFEF